METLFDLKFGVNQNMSSLYQLSVRTKVVVIIVYLSAYNIKK